MKNILLLLLLFTGIVKGQVVNIPDVNFKAKLLEANSTNTIAKDLSNQFTTIDANNNGEIEVTEANNISFLNISNSAISSMDGIEAFMNLKQLDCTGNLFSLLDVSGLPRLDILRADSNPNLIYLILKNGLINFNVPPDPPQPPGIGGANFTACPNLQYVCTDETKILDGQLYLNAYYSGSNVTLNTYCSFSPGGPYNTISGIIKFDDENNGCDIGDLAQPFTKVKISDGTNSGSFFTDTNGNYNFYTQNGNFTITPEVQNPSYFTISPASQVIIFDAVDNSTQIQDFCVVANGVHPDLEIVIVPIGGAVPGNNAEYTLIYKNKGNQVQSGSINLSFDDSKTDFVSATPSVANQGFNSLLWFYTSLQPFETRKITFVLNINSAVETPPVNVGDSLSFTANINFTDGDETPLDNFFNLSQITVNSLDLNSKICLQGLQLAPERIGDYLHYNINFENIGTQDATNIVVEDLIDASKLDVSTLQVLYGSDPLETKVTGSKVEFIFRDINLPRASINPIGGHGNVLFKIKTLPTLSGGDIISNTGTIYFDYNAPTQTNEARTDILLSNIQFVKDKTIAIAPNPTKNIINITSKNSIQSIQIFDLQGRLLQMSFENKTTTTLDISSKTNGIYLLKVTTNAGSSMEKIIKE